MSRPRVSAGTQPSGSLRVEISADRLLELLRMGSLCAMDLRCLDAGSKRALRALCLQACKFERPGGSRWICPLQPGPAS